MSCILGIGKGLSLIILFSSLKSEMKRTEPSFLGMIKVGAAHLDWFTCLSTPAFTSLSTSNFRVAVLPYARPMWWKLCVTMIKNEFLTLKWLGLTGYSQLGTHRDHLAFSWESWIPVGLMNNFKEEIK